MHGITESVMGKMEKNIRLLKAYMSSEYMTQLYSTSLTTNK